MTLIVYRAETGEVVWVRHVNDTHAPSAFPDALREIIPVWREAGLKVWQVPGHTHIEPGQYRVVETKDGLLVLAMESESWLPKLREMVESGGPFAEAADTPIARTAERPYNPRGVACVVVTHNRAAWLPACLLSVQRQTTQPHEIVIVLNSCTDNSREVVQHWQDQNGAFAQGATILECDFGKDYNAARMVGYRETKSPFLWFVDDDDTYGPDLVAQGMEAMKDARVAIAYPRMISFEGDAATGAQKEWEIPEYSYHTLRMGNYISNAALIRRTAFEEAGGWGECRYYFTDWRLWMLITRIGWRAKKINAIRYERVHEGQTRVERDVRHECYTKAIVATNDVAVFTCWSGKADCFGEVFDSIAAILAAHPAWRWYCVDQSGGGDFSLRLKERITQAGLWERTTYALDPTPPCRNRTEPGAVENIARHWNWAAKHITEDLLLSIEDDMKVPPDLFERLVPGLDHHTVVAGAFYHDRLDPSRYIAWNLMVPFQSYPMAVQVQPGTFLDVDMPAVGATLIRWTLIEASGIVFRPDVEEGHGRSCDTAFF